MAGYQSAAHTANPRQPNFVIRPPTLTMPAPVPALALRTALVLLTSLSLHVTCTPPHPPPPPGARYEPQDVTDRAFVATAVVVKVLLWAAAASELRLAYTHPAVRPNLGVDAVMLAGCAAAVLGGWTRARCYRLLGRRFTFELATHGAIDEQAKGAGAGDERPNGDHTTPREANVDSPNQLVTSGPYAVVRHPSYSGACLAFYGAVAVLLAPRSATRLSGGPGTPILALLALLALAPLRTLPHRIAREERMLASEFTDAWARYAARVRWRLMPGVY